MRVLGVVLLVVGVCAIPAAAISLCEHRLPESSIADARLAFAYRYYDDASTPFIDADSGRLAASYGLLLDSSHLGVSLAAASEFALANFVPAAWLGRGSVAARLYPWDDVIPFLFAGLEGVAATGLVRAGLDVRAGIGIGRIGDVTPWAKAMRVGRALVSLGTVPGGLADDVLLAIAKMIGQAQDYASEEDLLADIEAVVEFGAGVPLDARALLTIEDVVRSAGKERSCGWALAAGVGYELLDPYGGDQDFVYAASADAALASGPDDQFVSHLSFSGPFSALDESTLSAAATYALDFGDGGTLTAGYTLLRVEPTGASATTTHEAGLGISFSVGPGSLGLQVSATRRSGDPGWSIDVSMSASLELL